MKPLAWQCNSHRMTPTRMSDQAYLRSEQYRNAGNLNARIALHERFSVNPQGWAAWAFAQWCDVLPHDARILEVGCGSGLIWSRNRDRVPAGWRVTLTDFSPGMLAAARTALGASAERYAFAEADAQALPFAADSFDAVIAHHMLYHVPDRTKAYAEFRRVLAPGGRVIVALNGRAHLAGIDDLVAAYDPKAAPAGNSPNEALPWEMAEAELGGVFPRIEVRPYADELAVTEVAPLVDYVLSDFRHVVADVPAFTRFVTKRLERAGGVMRFRKDSALIVVRP